MNALAWIYIGASVCQFLPGSSFKRRPALRDYNWQGTHVYLSIAMTLSGIALAVWTVAA